MGAVLTIARPLEDVLSDDDAFAVWAMHMNAAGNVPRTVSERRYTMGSYARFIGKPVMSATRYDLIAFLAQPHLSPRTKQNYRSFLHTFYTLMQDEGLRADNPATRLPRGKPPRTEANPFTTAEVQLILDSGIYGRTRMMVLLAAYQGFRAVEIAAAAGRNLNWETRQILTVDGKGGVEVWRPLHPVVWEHAQDFPREDFWFPGTKSRAGSHIKPSSVSNTLSQALARTSIHGHRPHQLRAWFANEMVEAGADMLTVQHAMRHASPATLKHYVRPSMTKMSDAMSQLPELTARRQGTQ